MDQERIAIREALVIAGLADFVNRMMAKGYTEKQVRLLAEWYLRVHKSS
mgnify:CR=1 FL=1